MSQTLIGIAEDTAQRAGCQRFETLHGGKHYKFVVHGLRGHRTVTISKSPSCPFVGKKVAADVRRALKEVGYVI